MPGGFRRKRARGEERVRVDGNGLRRAVVGDAGLDDAELRARLDGLAIPADRLDRQRRIGWAVGAAERADVRRIVRLAEEIRGEATDVVLLTDPETAAGARAVAAALALDAAGAAPRLHVVGGADPERFAALLARLDCARTLFVVASAGAVDVATVGRCLIVRDRLLRELGAVAYRRHLVLVTSPEDEALRQIVHDEGFRSVPLPAGVDDRAAVASAAALVPLACAGADVTELAAGAAAMLARCHAPDGGRPAHLLAAALGLATTGVRVVAPATDALVDLAAWMERRIASDAPAAADDAADRRRVVVVLDRSHPAALLEVPRAYQDLEGIACAGGRDLATLAEHARDAAEMACWAAGALTLTVTLPSLSPHVVGQLVALTDAAVMLAAARDTDAPPARAPAIRLAWALVGRTGHEAERAVAARAAAVREDRYVA